MLGIKRVNDEYNVSAWKSKGIYSSVHKPLVYLTPIIKYFATKIRLQFNYSVLVAEQKNYATRIVNAYIVYDLDNQPRIRLNSFTLKKLKNCFFGASKVVKYNYESKCAYSG